MLLKEEEEAFVSIWNGNSSDPQEEAIEQKG